jgi:hypothetical protein
MNRTSRGMSELQAFFLIPVPMRQPCSAAGNTNTHARKRQSLPLPMRNE